jgi:alpha-tubulin suppressor-like RCC1 family protein
VVHHDELPTGPVSIGARALAVGMSGPACALLETSEVRCWGLGGAGRLGHGDATCIGCPDPARPTCCIGDDELPSDWPVVDVGAPAVALSVANAVTCILTPDGRVRVWGGGYPGATGLARGDEDIGDDEPPSAAPDVDVGGTAVAIACGDPNCALLDDGTLRCWGYANVGYAVAESIGDDETPSSMGPIALPGRVTAIAAAPGHVCAIVEGGALYCWGDSDHGELGYGNTEALGDDETPASAGPVDIGGAAVQIAAGENQTCAVRSDGALLCWGNNNNGELGYGHTDNIGDDEMPASAGPVPWL